MEHDCEIVLRQSRTPRNEELLRDRAVRESLLSESTSGICKDSGDTTSVSTDSFSSPDLDIHDKEHYEQVDFIMYENVQSQDTSSAHVKNNIEKNAISKEFSKLIIPDGGWGWVVVLSSFVISMIADGISFSFGLLYIEFLEEFGASKSTTAWIGSLFIAVPLLAGPVMSALVDRYGCRSMTILGGVISTLGFILASISTTLEMMMITFGVIAGLGLGLVYVTAVVSIAYWFEKKRNLAVGLGACGTGVGTFVYAPMTQYFIEEYGWRGTILLLSGTLLNLCVCGCVMRDPDWWILEQTRQNTKLSKKGDLKNSSALSITNPYTSDFEAPSRGKIMDSLIKRGVSPDLVIRQEVAVIKRRNNALSLQLRNERSKSVKDLPTYLTNSDKTMKDGFLKDVSKDSHAAGNHPNFVTSCKSDHINKNTKFNEDLDDMTAVNNSILSVQRTKSDKCDIKDQNNFELHKLKNSRQEKILQKTNSETKEDRPLLKQDSKENKRDWFKRQLSVNHHYLKDLKMPITSLSHRNAMLNIKKYRLRASSCPNIYKNSIITIVDKEDKWYADCITCLSDMFNINLFRRHTFNLLCFGTIILFVWFIVPYFYLAEHMIHSGYNEDDSAIMLSLIGITNTIGMIGLGWIGDFPRVSISNLYAVCLILCGASVAAIPQAVSNYWALVSMSCSFGLLFAASFTFTPSLLVKLVSLDDFTSAYGLVLLAQGIGHLIGPPLSGLIYDLTFSWELSFYLAGGWIIVAGVLISFIQPVKDYQEKRIGLQEMRNGHSMA